MKYFKTEASRNAPRHVISPESFQANTENKYPFVQSGSTGKLTAYGICPYCLNPIQLIGIFSEIKVTPYGKHTGKAITDLPEWNFLKYKYCPFATDGSKQPTDSEQLIQPDSSVIELYDLLKSQFDRVVYIIQNELHIHCSDKFWGNSLKKYIASRSYCYPWLTESNLPYIFAYWGMQQCNCFAQEFEIGTDLYKSLESYPNAIFKDVGCKQNFRRLYNNGKFFKPVFRFTDHRHIAQSGKELKESIRFCVDDNDNGKTIFEQVIQIDETYFMNLVNKKENENKRQQNFLDIAKEYMSPLLLNS